MRRWLALAFCTCVLTGTPAVFADAGTLPGSSLRASGFLGNYADLSKVPGRLDTWQWVRPGVDWKPYDKILVQPSEVWINTEAAYPGIEPGLYKQLTDHFRQTLIDTFRSGGYQIVDKPGPGVLRLPAQRRCSVSSPRAQHANARGNSQAEIATGARR